MMAQKHADSGSKRTLVMGIVNVTPDSFSDGGRWYTPESALRHALELVDQGADMIDLGAESTRPGAESISVEEEWRRLEPVLQLLVPRCPVPISIDTYKSQIAKWALDMGASIINDIWGGLADPDMLKVVAKAECTYIWMHNRSQPSSDPLSALFGETASGIRRCLDAGIDEHRLWLDPGIGFGKTPEQNLVVLRDLKRYCSLGWPVLLGASRKRFIGQVLGGQADDRLEGSLAVAAWAVAQGVQIVRVHDVKATAKVCRMTEAIHYA